MMNILKRKVQLLVGRCVINTIKNDKYQIELLSDEVRDEIEIMQHFGFKSIPLKNSKGLTLSVGGMRDDTVIIATDNKTAPEVKEGESTVYNNFSERIELLEKKINMLGKEINIEGNEINIEGKTTNINGSSKQLVTHAELDLALQQFVISLNTHTHIVPTAMPLPPAIAPPPTTPPLIPAILNISASKTTTINVE